MPDQQLRRYALRRHPAHSGQQVAHIRRKVGIGKFAPEWPSPVKSNRSTAMRQQRCRPRRAFWPIQPRGQGIAQGPGECDAFGLHGGPLEIATSQVGGRILWPAPPCILFDCNLARMALMRPSVPGRHLPLPYSGGARQEIAGWHPRPQGRIVKKITRTGNLSWVLASNRS